MRHFAEVPDRSDVAHGRRGQADPDLRDASTSPRGHAKQVPSHRAPPRRHPVPPRRAPAWRRAAGHDTTWTPSRSHHELSCAALTSPSSSSSDPSSPELQLCRRCMAFALLTVSTPNLAVPQHRSSLPSPVLTGTTSKLPFFGTRLLLLRLQHPHAPPQPRRRTARAAGGHSLAVPCAGHRSAPGRIQLAASQPQLVVAGHWPAANQQLAKQAAAGRGKSRTCCNNPAPPRSSLEPRRRRSRCRQVLAFPFLSLILDRTLDT